MDLSNLKVKIFSDGADLKTMIEMNSKDYIKGLTTNPTLMRQSGITNYSQFAQKVLSEIKSKPISFEVFSDDFDEMYDQALKITSWGENTYVKIPVTNSKGRSSENLITKLSHEGIKVNVTAIMTLNQVQKISSCLNPEIDSYISIFAGRIADTGIDPVPIMKNALKLINNNKKCELIWASPRELLNIIQADNIGCHIITVTHDLLKKLKFIGYDLDKYSLDTVQMFYNDSVVAGFKI